jgi:hypothetical protein
VCNPECHVSVYGYDAVRADGVCEEVVKRFEVLRELEGRVDLSMLTMRLCKYRVQVHTSDSSTSGGPSAMSSAFVPGRILRSAACWRLLNSSCCCSGEADTGDSWSSGIGGGLGSRGEAGDVILDIGCKRWFGEQYRTSVQQADQWVGWLCVVDFRTS